MNLKNIIILLMFVGISLYFFAGVQRNMLYPGNDNPKLKETVIESSTSTTVKYENLNNNLVKTIFIKGEEEKPLIIFFHGNFELIDYSVSIFEYLSQNFGFNTLMVEYNGYGSSEGKPSLENTTASVMEWLSINNKNKQKHIVWGKSIGSAHALHFTERNPEIVNKIIIQSGFMSPLNALTNNKIIENLLKTLMFSDFEADWKIDSIAKQKHLKNAIIIHGDKDQLFNISIAKELRERFIKNNIETKYIELDGGHNGLVVNYEEIGNYLLSSPK